MRCGNRQDSMPRGARESTASSLAARGALLPTIHSKTRGCASCTHCANWVCRLSCRQSGRRALTSSSCLSWSANYPYMCPTQSSRGTQASTALICVCSPAHACLSALRSLATLTRPCTGRSLPSCSFPAPTPRAPRDAHATRARHERRYYSNPAACAAAGGATTTPLPSFRVTKRTHEWEPCTTLSAGSGTVRPLRCHLEVVCQPNRMSSRCSPRRCDGPYLQLLTNNLPGPCRAAPPSTAFGGHRGRLRRPQAAFGWQGLLPKTPFFAARRWAISLAASITSAVVTALVVSATDPAFPRSGGGLLSHPMVWTQGRVPSRRICAGAALLLLVANPWVGRNTVVRYNGDAATP
jgi:hypothetical protein